ncbi:XK-related protein 5-like, partial [Saccostrea cucullata]|uniref:XK-related protein 5-like n=1 Tax=Saccostrea cuccullata TaxID=36930 RepID=UPI002ED0B46F
NTIYLYYVYKSKKNGIKKHDYYERMIKSNHYASLLRMIYAFIESVPQLVLQFYLIVKEHENPKDCEDISIYRHIIRRSSVLFSWVSVTWSVTASYQAIRVSNAMYKPRQKTVFAATGCFLWRAFEIGPRVMALVMLILVNSFGFAVTVVFHWIAMVTWSFATTEMRLYKKTYENIIFILFVGFVQIFSFMIFRPSKSQEDAKSTNPNKTRKDAKNDNSIQTEYHALFYYFFVYIENTIILILWILVKNNSFCPWIYHRSIGIVSGGLICNIVFMIFYKLCNPKASIW